MGIIRSRPSEHQSMPSPSTGYGLVSRAQILANHVCESAPMRRTINLPPDRLVNNVVLQRHIGGDREFKWLVIVVPFAS